MGLSTYQIILAYLSSVVTNEWIARILEQYPPLAVVLIYAYWSRKTQREDVKETNERLEKMLETQRQHLKEIYEGQQTFIANLISQIEAKQNKMADRIELLTQQIAVNTSTVSEIAKVDSIVSELISRLEKK